MTNFPVGTLVLDACVERLKDSVDGFNNTFNNLAPFYNVDADMAIDFDSDDSPNFCLGNVSPDDWMQTSGTKYPLVTLFTDEEGNQNKQKFHQYSGPVVIGLNVFIDWKTARVQRNFEKTSACVAETVYTVFNRARNANPFDQDWGPEIAYNGEIDLQKSRIERGSGFFRQGLMFRLIFHVDQRGEV